jgi:hypothetical protein
VTRLGRGAAETLAGQIAAFDPLVELRIELRPVVEAILKRRPPRRIEKLAVRVASSLWLHGLNGAAERGLDRLQADAERTLAQVAAARAELTRPPARNRLAQYLVLSASLRAAHEAQHLRYALETTEAELLETPLERRPTVALRSAGRIVAWRGDVPPAELLPAAARVGAALGEEPDLDLAEPSARALAQAVATSERREAVRRAAHDLRDASAGCPLFSEALDDLLADEPAPDAGDDDLWVVTVMGALELC